MRIAVFSVTMFSLGACAHSESHTATRVEALPALSVQRQLELKAGYAGAPGTMAFGDLPQGEAPLSAAPAHTPDPARANSKEDGSRDVAVTWTPSESYDN